MTEKQLEKIYEEFREEFRPFAWKNLYYNNDLVDEAMQETIVRAFEKRSEFQHKYGKRGVFGWLYKILSNVCYEMRRKKGGPDTETYNLAPSLLDELTGNNKIREPEAKSAEDEVYENLIDKYENSVLQEVIARTTLTNLEWAIVTASRLGFTIAEIAPELGIQPNGVRAHYSNAMPKLRATAQEYGGCLDHRRPI